MQQSWRRLLALELCLLGAVCSCLITGAANAAPADLDALLVGVHEIGSPGLPGTISVFGDRAFPIIVGKSGTAREPLVAAAAADATAQAANGQIPPAGKIVAFGHDGYFRPDALQVADTGRLLTNAVRWAARPGNAARVLVAGDPPLTDWLKAHGVSARTGTILPAELAATDLLIISGLDLRPPDVGPISAYVGGGGGLITAVTGWGWEQLNPGRHLATDCPANALLAPFGLAFSTGTLERTSPNGFTTAPLPGPLTHAATALDAVLGAVRGQRQLTPDDAAQVEATVSAAALAAPPGDQLFRPRLQDLTRGSTGDIVPFARKPVAKADLAARLLLTLQVNALKALPPEQVRAHPAGAIFPGDVPEGVRPVTRALAINTKVPGWHSLGLYAAPGATVTVECPEAAAGKELGVRIGCHSDTLWHLDRWTRVPEITRAFALYTAKTTAGNAFGGLVYITVPEGSQLGTVSVQVSGAFEAPLYVLGQTSLDEWRKTIRLRPAPWAELATDSIILTLPSRVVRGLDDPESLMKYWDAGMDAVADLATIPRDRPRPERIVADEQISAGYMHSGYPIMTWLDVVDMDVDLPRLLQGTWGQWHEVGHNHQMPDWTFEGTGEVTNNMFALYVNETVAHIPGGRAHPNVQPPWQQQALKTYLAGGANFEKWKSDPFLALTMYMQLQQAFGWDAYKKVFAAYRVLPANERPKSDQDKRDQWLVRFSRTVNKNLGPFFQAWGVPTTDKARTAIANLPPWMPPDWPATL